ncbi:hypothetical protein [Sphingomonas sp.]|uniref:hypothetical protein n=1 Tax=Sphingomonas sp. TaxID=28214 RepID=UPI00307DDF2E
MRYFLLREPDGDSYVSWDRDDLPSATPGCSKPIEVPRLPEAFERWDVDAYAFVRDEIAAIDAVHDPVAVARAHARKALEADLILSGFELPVSLLAAEAAATGQSIDDLARVVANRARADIEAEVARIVAKRAARRTGE